MPERKPQERRPERRVKLQDLRVLMAVAEAGSMGKAAQSLHTCQPAVSRSISELERMLGVRLLDRNRQGVQPTPYGRALLDCGSTVFDDLRRGLEAIRFLADPTAGELRIGCNPFLASSFVACVVARIAERYSRTTFDVVALPMESLYSELRTRRVDVLVTRRAAEGDVEGTSFEPLFHDTFVVVAGHDHPLGRRRKLALAELAGEPWVLPPPESLIGRATTQAFRSSGLPDVRARVVAIPLEMRLSLVASAGFLTVFPASALRPAGRFENLKVLPVRLPAPPITNGIVRLKGRTLSPVAELFIEEAHEAAKRFPRHS